MRHGALFFLGSLALAFKVAAQSAVDVARPEERQEARQAVVKEQEKRAKQASIIEFRGEQAFNGKAAADCSEGGNHHRRRLRAKSGARRRSRVFSRSLLPQAWLCGRECALHDRIAEPVAPRYHRGSALYGGDDRLRWECARAKRQAL